MLQLYIDPGTGSMLFTVVLGLITTLYFLFQKVLVWMKFRLSVGKIDKKSFEKKNIVIFSDNKNYWSVFKPICDEFENRSIPVEYWTASADDPALRELYQYVHCEFIGEGNKAFSRLNMMSSRICLATTPGLDVLQWKRSKNVDYYVHILHAAGTSAGGYRMFSLDYYDAVILTGEFQIEEIRELERKRNLPQKEVQVLGCTYMDALKARLETVPQKEHTKDVLTVLLAPSWGKSSILVRYGKKIIDSLLSTGYKIIIRPHPQSFRSDRDIIDDLQHIYPDGEQLVWDREGDNFNSLNVADIMISDFSSVVFDFALVFNKPFIYTEGAFDKAPYEAMWLDEELWKFRVLPTIGVPLKEEQFSNMGDVIRNTISNRSLAEGRERARKESWANIGESSKLTVEYLIGKIDQLKRETDPEYAIDA